jgi:hypothetical protein
MRCAVLHEGRTRERPAADGQCRKDAREKDDTSFESLTRERERERDDHECRRDAGTREREHQCEARGVRQQRSSRAQLGPSSLYSEPERQAEACIREQRECVPVVDRHT